MGVYMGKDPMNMKAGARGRSTSQGIISKSPEAGRGHETARSVFVRKRYLDHSRNQLTEALIASDLQSPELLHRDSCPSSHPGSATSLE